MNKANEECKSEINRVTVRCSLRFGVLRRYALRARESMAYWEWRLTYVWNYGMRGVWDSTVGVSNFVSRQPQCYKLCDLLRRLGRSENKLRKNSSIFYFTQMLNDLRPIDTSLHFYWIYIAQLQNSSWLCAVVRIQLQMASNKFSQWR